MVLVPETKRFLDLLPGHFAGHCAEKSNFPGDFPGDFPGYRLYGRSCPHVGVRPKRSREEAVDLEFRLGAALRACLVSDASDTGARLLYEVDAVEQISDQRVPSDALAAKIGKGQASRQTARTYHFHTVGVDLDEDVGPFHKPVAVHDGVRDRLS